MKTQTQTTLNWKRANKRQQSQYHISNEALVASVKTVTIDDGRVDFVVHAEIVAAGDYVQFYFWDDNPNPFERLDLFITKSVAGYDLERKAAEDMFDPKRIYMNWFKRDGWTVEA